jgi:uncharacterized protein (TIGR00661 family)
MFFPTASKRLACSFFRVAKSHVGALENVEIMPPVLRDEVINLKNHPKTEKPSLLVYLTAQQPLYQSLDEITKACEAAQNADIHIFVPKKQPLPDDQNNIRFYHHGDSRFNEILGAAHGVVSTAGHTLLSEAMYLGIPVYAMPLNLYEQQMNAQVIQDNNFGISEQKLTPEKLAEFAENLATYAKNIENDSTALLRKAGQDIIIDKIRQTLNGLEKSQPMLG